MKTHTNDFKSKIKEFGRELDSKITYTISGVTTELGTEQLNSVTPHYQGAILKSVMKQLDIDSNVEIPEGTELNYQFGVKVGNSYEYIDYGNYVVKSVEKQEDTRSWKITCYDKMLYAMKEYENSSIVFPITIRDYINAICGKCNLTFANLSDTFSNYDKTINNELYLDTDGNTLGYTFRDVLDELAQVTASTICINDDDELEIRYINDTVGKNLFKLKTPDYTGQDAWSGYGGTSNYTLLDNGFKFINRYCSIAFAFNNLDVGEKYTVSFDAISDVSSSASVGVNVYRNSTDSNKTSKSYSVSTTSQRVSFTFTAIATNRIAFHSGSTQNIQITITNIQLEKGEQATSYEPYGDTIDEEYLKDVNVNFGDKFGPVNTIVLSRGGDGDKISLSNPTNLSNDDKIAIQISDNQIMNGNDRDTYMSDILTKLYGLEYYINDYTSTGVCYYDLCDKYNIKIDDTFYSCIMFNDSVEITQGLKEDIYTDMQEENEQEYKYMSSTDRGITQANIIANKAEGTITEYTQRLNEDESKLNALETKQTDTERTIQVMSTNIDANGNITEVTTTTGFTFNKDGMTISDSDTNFSALHRNDGTYYYDGTNVVGQYTKEGSKQKDLSLFGVYYYGMDEITDTPMFVAQLYTDEDGEECMGHFYNRGD